MTSEALITHIFKLASRLDIPMVIIGGLALPAYDVARTTLDVDISGYFRIQTILDSFIEALRVEGIKTLQTPKISHDLFTVFGYNNEAEIWLKPCDAFGWDEKMVDHIKKYSKTISVLSLEDFIATKLARADRSTIDISDILQILINNHNLLDWEYFKYRLEWADLRDDFKAIFIGLEYDLNSELKSIIQKILKKIE